MRRSGWDITGGDSEAVGNGCGGRIRRIDSESTPTNRRHTKSYRIKENEASDGMDRRRKNRSLIRENERTLIAPRTVPVERMHGKHGDSEIGRGLGCLGTPCAQRG